MQQQSAATVSCAAAPSCTEPLAQLLERVASGSGGHFGVDLHGDGDLAVPQDLHGHARMDVKRREQLAACPVRAMHRDGRDTGLNDAAVEAAVEVARLDRSPASGREHQPGVGPDP